ncbi:MAG: response regulator [Desulfuromonadales bacterium]|nr:response regulator [Desulfuromonadales bacterium]NIR33250.1 response regulator [Desulfuromonadales bacterium]NIS41850.1 response regulator [Desulfuromonadales bacterium]
MLLAESGREAFRLIEEEDPDLVFLDPDMEDLSGIDCCEMVKNDPILKITPIIAVLPKEKGDSLTDCCRELFDDILPKPVEEQRLLSVTCRFLGICERPNRRILAQMPAHFRYKGRRRHGQTQDISAGGAFIETRHLVPVDTELDVEIEFPGREEMATFGARVAWVNHPEWIKKDDFPCGMGIGFLDIPEEAREALEEFLEGKIG